MMPAKADPDGQAAYLDNELEPRLVEAQAGQRAVFVVDAAPFGLAPFLGFLWSLTRLFIQAPCGRQRFNVLAALNAVPHELVTVTNGAYITSVQVCQLVKKVTDRHLSVSITLFLDYAAYQRCALVRETATRLHIELCCLPTRPISTSLSACGSLCAYSVCSPITTLTSLLSRLPSPPA